MATPAIAARRQVRRAVGLLVVLAGIVVVGLAAISQTATFRDWLRRQVLVRLNARMAGQVVVGSLDGNLFGRLVATDVRVMLEGQRVLAIRRLAATYEVLTLIAGGGLRIRSVEGDGVALQLVADERGWNVARLTRKPTAAGGGDLAVTLESVCITNGALRVIRPERAWRFRGLMLAGTARFGPGATRLALSSLSFTEQGSGIRLEEASGRLAIDPDTGLDAEGVRLRTAGSQLGFDGRIGPSGARDVDAHLSVPRLAAAELRALLGERVPESDWRSELHAVGPAAAVVVTGDLHAVVAGDGERREVGRVRLDGTVDLRDPMPSGELRAALEHVDLGGIVGPALPPSDLTGLLRLATRADAPRTVRFGLELRDPRVGAATLSTVALTGSADAETVRFEADAAMPAGAARLTGTIVPKAERFDLRLAANGLDPGGLGGPPELGGRVNGTVTLAGEGFRPATARADLAVVVTPSRVGAVTISSGALTARAEAGRLVVERATVVTNAGTAEVSGDLGLGSADAAGAGGVRGAVRVTDLRPLGALLGRPGMSGAATAMVSARGRLRALDAKATVTGRGLAGPGWRAATLEAAFDGARLGDPQTEAEVQVRGRARDVTVAERRLSGVELKGWWRGTAVAAGAGFELSGREAAAQHQLDAEMTFRADETRVTITTLRFDHQGQSWVATGTPVLVQRGERLTIDDFAVRSAQGGGRVRGVLTRTGESDLELVVDGLDLEVLAGLIPDDVSGRLVGRAHVGGTLAAPRLDADVVVATPTLGGVRYDELRARLVADEGRAELHGRLARASARALVVDGSVPVRFGLEPWRFETTGDLAGRLRADDVDLAFLGSLWPGLVTNVGGTMTADVTLGGSWAAPEARGTVALAGGRGHVVPLGLGYDPVELELRLEGRVVSIGRLAIQSGNGRLTGGGAARLGAAGTTMDARFEAKRFPLFANQYGRGAASGWLWISGTVAAPVLEGSLETDGLVLQIPEVLPGGAPKADPTIVVIGPGAPAPMAAPSSAPGPATVPAIVDRAAVTVQLAVPRNAWVRRSDANVELQGWMTTWKKPGEDFHLAGDIRGVRGWYAFQGKKFALAEGSVRFSGQGLDPALDIVATHKAGEYLVRLRVGGTITKPSLALESAPALEQADVLAVVLFGAPANQLSRSQSTGLGEQALGIAGGYVASELRQSVANALGVDDLQFDTGTTGLEDARVSIGKYVADDIFVSLAHRFGAQSVEEVRIEYVIRPGWSLETSTDTLGRSGADLFWKRRY